MMHDPSSHLDMSGFDHFGVNPWIWTCSDVFIHVSICVYTCVCICMYMHIHVYMPLEPLGLYGIHMHHLHAMQCNVGRSHVPMRVQIWSHYGLIQGPDPPEMSSWGYPHEMISRGYDHIRTPSPWGGMSRMETPWCTMHFI